MSGEKQFMDNRCQRLHLAVDLGGCSSLGAVCIDLGWSRVYSAMQCEAEWSEICGMNNRLDIMYFFVPADRDYSSLTRHALNAPPHLGVAGRAAGDNLMANRLYANHKGGFEAGMDFS